MMMMMMIMMMMKRAEARHSRENGNPDFFSGAGVSDAGVMLNAVKHLVR